MYIGSVCTRNRKYSTWRRSNRSFFICECALIKRTVAVWHKAAREALVACWWDVCS